MELEVMKPNRLEDGKHIGIITALEERHKPYEYLDVVIEVTNGTQKTTIKCGYARTLMKESKLGLLLKRFGCELIEGKIIDPSKLLVGKKCSFVVMNEATNRGTFPKIIADSLKVEP